MELPKSKRVRRLLDRVIATRKNCAFEDLENLLRALGFSERKSTGSHVFFKRGRIAISIPKNKPVKERYVGQALKIIVEMLGDG